MPKPLEGASLMSALTDFTFSRFATVKLVPVLYLLGLLIGGILAASYLLTALRLGVLVGLVGLVLVPLTYLVYALYLRVVLELVIVLFRIESGIARMAGPGSPEP